MKSSKVREERCLCNLNYSPMHTYYDTVSNYVLTCCFSTRFSLHPYQNGWGSLGEDYLLFYFYFVLIKQNHDTVLCTIESMGTIKIFLREHSTE